MAREKKKEPPGDDIPAWFMTYSDVITLLMTFFILLLTFATTEPERFEKSVSSTFSKGAATGTAGAKLDGMVKDSFVNRLRPPAARIAMRGAEMPPIDRAPASATFGAGLRSLTEEESKPNELTSHGFKVPISKMFDSQGELTSAGRMICKMMSKQLLELPFQAAVQFSNPKDAPKLAGMMSYLFDIEKTRPGQVAMSLVKGGSSTGSGSTKIAKPLESSMIRISIRRFSENAR
ncbi:MAG: chemotaxis protein MotB [Mariniblastus sp.]|jgi:chemotaxis protein MotB